ncbi:MAG: hypothetical protein ACLGPM_06365 [Acidobacteriota bacterium]
MRIKPHILALMCLLASPLCCAAQQALPQLDVSGHVVIDGQSVPYLIRHLPPASFPSLPPAISAALTSRGCLIPQTYEAYHPENAVHGSFESPGSSDWAVLCSVKGTTSLLVFFASRSAAEPFELSSAPETERLQMNGGTHVLGFNWAIDPASPQQVHQAQAGLDPRPPLIDHDALADSTIDHKTVYHFFAKGAWTLLAMPPD